MSVLATIDLTPITDIITALAVVLVASAAIAAAAALSVGAVYFGGKATWRFFKGMAR